MTRFLLIANGLVLVSVGALYIAYGARPGGLVVGAALIGIAILLFCGVPLTDPYRQEQRRARRSSQKG